MIEWTVVRADASEQTFDEAKIVNVTRTLLNQQSDTALVEFGYGDFRSPEPWLDKEWIEIRADGAIWFAGRNRGFTPGASGRNETFTCLLTGPWEDLERTIFTRTQVFGADPLENPALGSGSYTMGDFTTESLPFSIVYSGLAANGGKLSTRQQILAALNYAIGKGANFQLGTIDAGRSFRAEELRGPTCAEMVRKALRWTPSQKVWFDYTTSPPTLHIRQLGNQAELELEMSDEEWEQVRLEDNRASMVTGVRIEYWQDNWRGNFRFRSMTVDDAGPSPLARDALILPIELNGSYLYNGAVVPGETPPEDLAQELYDLYKSSWLKGTIRLARAEVTDEAWTGLRLTVKGGNPHWKTNRCTVQKAVCSTANGRTELTVGPPDRLGPTELFRLFGGGVKPPPPPAHIAVMASGGSDDNGETPPTGSTPSLTWESGNPPDVILQVHYSTDCTFWHQMQVTGNGKLYADVHGSGTLMYQAVGMTIGAVVIVPGSGLRVGRGPDVVIGTNGVCNEEVRPRPNDYVYLGYTDDPETSERTYQIETVPQGPSGGCSC